MNSSINSAMQAYKEVYTDVAAETADPHKLVSMLFNGVSDKLCTAEQGFENEDLKIRGEHFESPKHPVRTPLNLGF